MEVCLPITRYTVNKVSPGSLGLDSRTPKEIVCAWLPMFSCQKGVQKKHIFHHLELTSSQYFIKSIFLKFFYMLNITAEKFQQIFCSKFSKPGFNSMWTVNFLMFKLDLEKAEEPEIKWPTSVGSSKKQESSRKTSISALLTMSKSLTLWITTTCENS